MKKRRQGVGTSAFIYNKEGKFLLVERSETDTYLPLTWELPGGGTEYCEDPKSAVIREVEEEVGLSVSAPFPLQTMSYYKEDPEIEKHIIDIVYYCVWKDHTEEVKLSFEHSNFVWTTFDELKKYTMSDAVKEMFILLKTHPLILEHLTVV